MPAIAWSASAQTFRFTYVNPAAETLLGYPVEAWLDDPNFWGDHLHPDDRHVPMLCHNETLAGRDHELVYRMIAADGRTVWLRDYVNVHHVDGVPVELFGVMVDITREREAEAASKENRENFRRMVERSPDCIGVHVDGKYVYVNKSFVQLLGAENEAQIVGSDVFSHLEPGYHEEVAHRLERLRAGESVPYIREKYRRIDGSSLDVEVAALPLRYGSRDAVQVIVRDISDRVRADEELQAREARLQLLASGTHEAIWEWSPERKELWTNDAYRQMLGVTGDSETFIDEWLARVHPDDRDGAAAVSRSAIHEESLNWWHEYRLQQADGTYRVVLERGHNVKSPAGERRVIGAMLDVTPLREAERMRGAAEAKFRWLVEESVVAVYMMSGGKLTYINDTGARMLGYSVDELMSMDLAALSYDDDRSAAGSGPNVARVRRKDGTPLHLAFYQNDVVIDGEQITIGTSADITESVYARQALEASEQRYRELVEDVTDILYTVDRDGCFVSLSRSFERSTGYRVEEWIGRPFADLFRPRSSSAHDAVLIDTGIREYDLPAQSGAVVTVEVSSQPRFVDGALAGTIGMARDVTEQRTIARKLDDARRMSSLGQVAASLAHEFNNVLMGIQPFVEVIGRHAPATRPVTEALGHITRALGRGKRASQEILRYVNPKEPQLFSIDTRAWLPALLGQLVAALPSTIALSSSMDPRVQCIRGDSEQLEQVITNLVFNARDAISSSGTIRIDVSLTTGDARDGADAEFVRISVSDDGPGITPAVLDRIFEPLFTTKRNGTGLGLTIARRLMEGQRGTLLAENRREGGSVFHILIPSAEGAAPSAYPFQRITPGVTRVLLVEDDVSVGTGLDDLLRSHGYETAWVLTAGEACAAAHHLRPHVAIVDVNLPDGNGVDLIPLLRAGHADLPVVLSTGHMDLTLPSGNNRTVSLMKPYEFDDLLAAIGRAAA